MKKVYTRIVWENFPSEKTALNERNLNKMDLALDNLDDRVVQMDSTKVSVETANTLIKSWTMDEETGVITVEKLNGEKILFDLNIEKIPVDFKLSEDGILTMTTDDGTRYTANIGAMIPVLTFEDSDTIAVSATGTGVNKTYSFSIKSGSVTEDKLQPNFLADVKTEVAKAQTSQISAAQSASAASNSATLAESYTHGGTGAREGEETDNAKYYMEQAKAVSAVDIMTGATAEKDGISGTVPAPLAGQQAYMLGGDGTWKSPLENEIIDAKIKELNKSIEDAIALRASLEAYGLVKVTDSSAVTDSTGLALAATEKNAAIEGTLANKISQLNTDFVKNLSPLTTNLLEPPILETKTKNGITCTNNGDGTYTLNGTSSDKTYFYIYSSSDSQKFLLWSEMGYELEKNYKLIGCPKCFDNNEISLNLFGYSYGRSDYGDGAIINVPSSKDSSYLFRIYVNSGVTVDNAVFKPMLTTNLDATYDDFVQYTGGKGRLNLDVADLYAKFMAASLIFSNVSVATSAWASDTTYTDYPYKATITCSGVTANHVPTVNFGLTDATSGIFAPVALSAANTVTIYASEKPTSAITIQSIVCVKGV